jgi:NADPH-dependent 2,4-dienoyl-CoA reductase/sulfur reductase-like enzyme/rhodanese-related sulfurtransferase
MKIVVIGASAAGLKAAARAKRLMPDAQIKVFDSGEHISYGACGLPYYLSGDIGSIDELMKTPYGVKRTTDFFSKVKGLDVYSKVEVVSIDRKNKSVSTKNLDSGSTEKIEYDKLVIATGASVLKPRIKGIDNPRIHYFKTVDDAVKLKRLLETAKLNRVGIIGGGYTGCELVEAFASMWGCEVVLFEAKEHILSTILDHEMAAKVQSYIEEKGINVYTSSAIEAVEESGYSFIIRTSNHDAFTVDRVIVSVGVTPEITLAKDCGLEIGSSGAIKVTDSMQTSDPDIYAAGDCVESVNTITKNYCNFPNGSIANRQGRIVGSNLAGLNEKFKPVTGAFVVKIFDYNIACCGINEITAKNNGIKAQALWGTFTDRIDYYPDFKNIHIKIIYDLETHIVLGFQGIGLGDSVKRCDVITNLIRNDGKIEDILDLEFCYAPPYATPLDPLYALASAILNHLDFGVSGVSPSSNLDDYDLIVDVRLKEEALKRKLEHPKVINIPITEFRSRFNELPKNKAILLVCSKGSRSAECAGILKRSGYKNVKYLGGGLLLSVNF